MTDNEIKKALKELLEVMLCEGDLQRTSTISHTIGLINRLQAENERLKQPASASFLFEKAKLDELSTRVVEFESNLKAKIKAEAYKEFAERLCEDRVSNDPVVIAAKCLLKEMVGEDNA